ncbi:MAG: aspartate dehydrogenase [Fervidobacterium sp.]|uniref:aspartate dehydrogenase n=1 Tax=Fervidobacterium sp. TaxID=1871331 RepID=UPI00404A33FF
MPKKINVFFIGGGNIARIVREDLRNHINLCWYYDLKKTDFDCQYLERFEIPQEVEVVVECASVEAVKEFGIDILKSGKDFYIISSGAFADEEFRATFLAELKNSSSNVYIPSGAIGGIDIVRAVRNYVEKIVLTTRKPPKAFGIDGIQEPKTIFSGNAVEAIKAFPQNTNVSVTLSLAVGNFEKVMVNVVADPNVNENIHEINIFSSVGNYTVIHKNKPSPNPKTSYLAPLSLAAAIKRNIEKFKI